MRSEPALESLLNRRLDARLLPWPLASLTARSQNSRSQSTLQKLLPANMRASESQHAWQDMVVGPDARQPRGPCAECGLAKAGQGRSDLVLRAALRPLVELLRFLVPVTARPVLRFAQRVGTPAYCLNLVQSGWHAHLKDVPAAVPVRAA